MENNISPRRKKVTTTIGLSAKNWQRIDKIGPSRGQAVELLLSLMRGDIELSITDALSIGRYKGKYCINSRGARAYYPTIERLMEAAIEASTPKGLESPENIKNYVRAITEKIEKICRVLEGAG